MSNDPKFVPVWDARVGAQFGPYPRDVARELAIVEREAVARAGGYGAFPVSTRPDRRWKQELCDSGTMYLMRRIRYAAEHNDLDRALALLDGVLPARGRDFGPCDETVKQDPCRALLFTRENLLQYGFERSFFPGVARTYLQQAMELLDYWLD